MEKLVIVRTNPTQGKSVKVNFENAATVYGSYGFAEFPFSLWLQFEKLIKDGMEARARIETKETRRIEVEFRPLIEPDVEAKFEADNGILSPGNAPSRALMEPGSIPGRKQREAPLEFKSIEPEPIVTLEERLARSLGGVGLVVVKDEDE